MSNGKFLYIFNGNLRSDFFQKLYVNIAFFVFSNYIYSSIPSNQVEVRL